MHQWQLDLIGGIYLADGRECKMLTGIDNHSRRIVVAEVLAVPSGRAVAEAFVRFMRIHRVPAEGSASTCRCSQSSTDALGVKTVGDRDPDLLSEETQRYPTMPLGQPLPQRVAEPAVGAIDLRMWRPKPFFAIWSRS